ncbi:MAG: putative lipoprotein [Alphaproteobacteria bacterium]|nr:putative lipoprotein [Alphaproteobacteria bacterium]
MKKLVLFGIALLAMTSCSTNKEYHYWQKSDPNTAIYLTGVKAQQTLEQDISECVHEIIELSKLSDVRGKVPETFQTLGSYDQKEATEAMARLPHWDVPEYILDLRVDHTEFHDFDGCMAYRGWKRVKYVGPEAEFRSKEIYDDTANYSVRPKSPVGESYDREMKALHEER